jgi:hypothetical protein
VQAEDGPIRIFGSGDYNAEITAVLFDFTPDNVKFDRPNPERQKVFFNIASKDDAKKCFIFFDRNRRIIPAARHKLYYVRPDEILLKYADL